MTCNECVQQFFFCHLWRFADGIFLCCCLLPGLHLTVHVLNDAYEYRICSFRSHDFLPGGQRLQVVKAGAHIDCAYVVNRQTGAVLQDMPQTFFGFGKYFPVTVVSLFSIFADECHQIVLLPEDYSCFKSCFILMNECLLLFCERCVFQQIFFHREWVIVCII